MKALSHQQIKQQELQLLETSGFSLGQCSNKLNSNKIIKELTNSLKVTEIQRLKVNRVRNLGLSANANLRCFSLALLTSIYSVHLKEDLLDIIKSFLYHPSLNLEAIKHNPLPQVSSKQMKKIVVEFFYSLVYSSYDDKIEGKLCKYPIIMDILVLFLRCLLIQMKVKHAEDYLLKLNTKESYQHLVDFFDLNCKVTNSMFLFYEDKLFLFQNQNGESLIGNYCENQTQKHNNISESNRIELSELSQQIQQDTENQRSQRPSTQHDRSLQLKGIVSESIVFQPQAPTPFFNFDQKNNSSFQSSHDNNEIQADRPGHNLVRSTKQTHLLKALDISMHQSQTNIAFGNLKRTMLENQLKESLESKELAMDSPITLDSPHTLFGEGNFAKPGEQKMDEKIKVMKKSKSESARPVSSNPSANNQEQSLTPANMKKKEKVEIGKPTKMKMGKCRCIQAKKQSIKLQSNLYEINMRFVASPSTASKKHKTSLDDVQYGDYYVSSKGLACQLYTPSSQTTSMQNIRQTYVRQKPKLNLNTSINSCYALPQVYKESETQSKRQFSPLSNFGERSFSPYGGTSSITSPKITFTYKNPLKYSIQIPKNKSKNKK